MVFTRTGAGASAAGPRRVPRTLRSAKTRHRRPSHAAPLANLPSLSPPVYAGPDNGVPVTWIDAILVSFVAVLLVGTFVHSSCSFLQPAAASPPLPPAPPARAWHLWQFQPVMPSWWRGM